MFCYPYPRGGFGARRGNFNARGGLTMRANQCNYPEAKHEKVSNVEDVKGVQRRDIKQELPCQRIFKKHQVSEKNKLQKLHVELAKLDQMNGDFELSRRILIEEIARLHGITEFVVHDLNKTFSAFAGTQILLKSMSKPFPMVIGSHVLFSDLSKPPPTITESHSSVSNLAEPANNHEHLPLPDLSKLPPAFSQHCFGFMDLKKSPPAFDQFWFGLCDVSKPTLKIFTSTPFTQKKGKNDTLAETDRLIKLTATHSENNFTARLNAYNESALLKEDDGLVPSDTVPLEDIVAKPPLLIDSFEFVVPEKRAVKKVLPIGQTPHMNRISLMMKRKLVLDASCIEDSPEVPKKPHVGGL